MYLFSDLAGVWANNCWTFAFISDSIEMAPYQQANRGIPREVASKGMEKVESKITYHVIKNKMWAFMQWLLPKLCVVTEELF